MADIIDRIYSRAPRSRRLRPWGKGRFEHMRKEPVLVVMAAGMGSRYGGLKQIDPVGDNGEIIIDFSLYDAVLAGFHKVVFLIKKDIEADFREVVGNRMSKFMDVKYAYQELDALPEGFSVPAGRKKPWGTAHAVLCCRDRIDAPFAVINSDDYYGREAFRLIYRYLADLENPRSSHYAMVGYRLENTLTENGHVARGVCTVSPEGFLTEIRERTHIEKRGDGAAYTEDGGKTWFPIPRGSIVSMNLWGFSEAVLDEIARGFPVFLKNEAARNPEKAEYFLPSVVDAQLKAGTADVRVLRTPDRWYGVTYRKDKPGVVEAMRRLKRAGFYPAELWKEKK